MTVQIAAASTALILGEERRSNGRWQYGQLSNSEFRKIFRNSEGHLKALRRCGLVLDVLGRDALRRVRDQDATLNAVYEQAQDAVREDQARAEREAMEAAAESEAREFIEANRPDLAEKVGADLNRAGSIRSIEFDLWPRSTLIRSSCTTRNRKPLASR